MSTILCSGEYLKKVIDMKKAGLAGLVKNLIMMDDVPQEQIGEASEQGLNVMTMS